MRFGDHLADMASSGHRLRHLGDRFLADNCRHAGFYPCRGQSGGKAGELDDGFVDGEFGFVQFGGDPLGCGDTIFEHAILPTRLDCRTWADCKDPVRRASPPDRAGRCRGRRMP